MLCCTSLLNSYISERHETLHTPYPRATIPNISANASKKTIIEIARIIDCHKSTISREIQRNRGKRGYLPKQANELARTRKANNSTKVTQFGWSYIRHLPDQYYSPEQITGQLRLMGWQDVPSQESIYKYIYADKKTGCQLYKALRCQKTYKKRHLQDQDRRGSIVNRCDIS